MNYRVCFMFALAFADVALRTEASPDANIQDDSEDVSGDNKTPSVNVNERRGKKGWREHKHIPASLVAACNLGDMECLKKSTELFIRKTHKGIPAYNISPIDPISIPSLDVAVDDSRSILNRNITVTGLGHQRLYDFKMDVKTGSVVLTTSADLNINGGTTLVFPMESISVSGHFWSYGRVLATARYSYTLKTDDKGVEHFEVGAENISCVNVDTPVVVFDSELAKICNDAFCPSNIKELMKQDFCEIVEKAYVAVVQNIRAAAKVVPSTAFFKNMHGN